MQRVPGYVPIVFILTTLASAAFLQFSINAAGRKAIPSRLLLLIVPLWCVLQALLAVSGFYQKTDTVPPRLVLFGVLPAFVLIIFYFAFFRASFVEKIPLRLLTVVHIVRIPVELVLLWLFAGGMIPRVMTFEGWNFDILSGLLAVLTYVVAFRTQSVSRWILVGFNLIGLALLANIVAIAVLSLPSPIQRLAFDQPNWGGAVISLHLAAHYSRAGGAV